MAKGFVLDAQRFPLSSIQAYQIGRANVKPNNNVTRAKAAEERIRKRKGFPGVHVLSGKSLKHLVPGEAARIAAERRSREANYCLTCNDVIDLINDTDTQDDSNCVTC